MKKYFYYFIPILILLVLFGNLILGSTLLETKKQKKYSSPLLKIEIEKKDTVSYKGENGKDALVLLKEKAAVEQDNSGLVVSINSRKAENKNREYWAFYINGKMAEVGPSDYKTKDGDKIEWKIEHY